MPRLSKKTKTEWSFFWNDETGRRAYNELCRKCRNKCKQSFRATVVCCPKYHPRRSAKTEPKSDNFNDSS